MLSFKSQWSSFHQMFQNTFSHIEQGRKACVQKSDFCTKKKLILTLWMCFRYFKTSSLTPIHLRTSLHLLLSLSPSKQRYPFCLSWYHLPWQFCNSCFSLPWKTIVLVLSCPDKQLDSFASSEDSLGFMLSFHDWWCQQTEVFDIPAIY